VYGIMVEMLVPHILPLTVARSLKSKKSFLSNLHHALRHCSLWDHDQNRYWLFCRYLALLSLLANNNKKGPWMGPFILYGWGTRIMSGLLPSTLRAGVANAPPFGIAPRDPRRTWARFSSLSLDNKKGPKMGPFILYGWGTRIRTLVGGVRDWFNPLPATCEFRASPRNALFHLTI
jgi:hypothetical protein